MAKLKSKSTSKTKSKSGTGSASTPLDELQHRAEQVSRSIIESAQQIWLAGVGAFSRAQEEGTRLFEALVKEGMNMEKSTRNLASSQVEKVRDAVEDRVGQARERAQDTWDRLEKVFEERVQRALNRLGVPSREELAALSERVEALTAELRRLSRAGNQQTATKTPRKTAAKKAPGRKSATQAKSGASHPLSDTPRPKPPSKA